MAFKAMAYEDMPIKVSKGAGRRSVVKQLDALGTPTILWHLAKRHKVGLLAVGNIILVLNWAFPAWTELVKPVL